MQGEYSAAIAVIKGARSVDLTFSQPLSPKTAAKIREFSQRYMDVQVYDIPQSLGKLGFWVMYSPELRNGELIAQEVLRLLISEGFDESRIRLINFTAS